MPYSKPYLTLPGQLALLKLRGLMVADDAAAIDCLHRNGYYRLSAYWYPFRAIDQSGTHTDTFLPNSHFEDAIKLYQFDKALKLHLLDALERVEIAARVEIALVLGLHDTFAHENPRMFDGRFTNPPGASNYDKWIRNFNDHVRRSQDAFMIHHRQKYGNRAPLPIWIAVELWDFGLLSWAFSGMKYKRQLAVAKRFSVPDPLVLESWLQSLNYVRNVIAHHGRLWNLNMNIAPSRPVRGDISEFDIWYSLPNVHTRVYSACCILSFLTHVINPSSLWIENLKRLIKEFPQVPHVSIQAMGFPANWETHGFWNYNAPPSAGRAK